VAIVAEAKNKGSLAGKLGAAVVGAAVGVAAGVVGSLLTDPKKRKSLSKAAKDAEKRAAGGLDKLSRSALDLQKKINKELKTHKRK